MNFLAVKISIDIDWQIFANIPSIQNEKDQ